MDDFGCENSAPALEFQGHVNRPRHHLQNLPAITKDFNQGVGSARRVLSGLKCFRRKADECSAMILATLKVIADCLGKQFELVPQAFRAWQQSWERGCF
jgi:hypothetical protein